MVWEVGVRGVEEQESGGPRKVSGKYRAESIKETILERIVQ
jgi:hypothetical protein